MIAEWASIYIDILWYTMPVSNQLRKPGCDMWNPVSNHLLDTESELHPETLGRPTCWPMLAREGTHWCMLVCSLLHISFIAQWFQCFYQPKFFHLIIARALALGESWLLLAQPQKITDVHKGLLPLEGFPKQTCINHIPRKQGCKLMDQI